MKEDVKKLLKHFEVAPKVKNGDLVLVAQIMRVENKDWGKRRNISKNDVGRKDVSVVTVFPPCTCNIAREQGECGHAHIMGRSKKGGQQVIMVLKER